MPPAADHWQPNGVPCSSVVVVGAGVAGLQTTRALLKAQFKVLCIEQWNDVGGIWSTRGDLQVPWQFQHFPEFPYSSWAANGTPGAMPSAPPVGGATVATTATAPTTARDVQDYIRAYARHVGLYDNILFNTSLRTLQPRAGGGWTVRFFDSQASKQRQVQADFVVMCTGACSKSTVPTYKGSEKLAGQHLHARDLSDGSVAAGKRVLVVGGGRTALDVAAQLAIRKHAKSITWLCRQTHWPIQPKLAGMLCSGSGLTSPRLPTMMLEPYYDASSFELARHKVLRPFKRMFWRTLERSLARQFKLGNGLKPPLPLDRDLCVGGHVLDCTWAELARDGHIKAVHGEIHHFEADGCVLQDGSRLGADLVLYCTGYQKSYDYLDGTMKSRLHLQKDGLYLYRSILPPHVRQLAYIGAEVSTFNQVLTCALQAEWLVGMLTGEMTCPTPEEMQDDIKKQQMWRRRVMPGQRHRGSAYMLYMDDYHKQLINDLGRGAHVKGCSPALWCLSSRSTGSYDDIFRPAKHAVQRKPPQPPAPPLRTSSTGALAAAVPRNRSSSGGGGSSSSDRDRVNAKPSGGLIPSPASEQQLSNTQTAWLEAGRGYGQPAANEISGGGGATAGQLQRSRAAAGTDVAPTRDSLRQRPTFHPLQRGGGSSSRLNIGSSALMLLPEGSSPEVSDPGSAAAATAGDELLPTYLRTPAASNDLAASADLAAAAAAEADDARDKAGYFECGPPSGERYAQYTTASSAPSLLNRDIRRTLSDSSSAAAQSPLHVTSFSASAVSSGRPRSPRASAQKMTTVVPPNGFPPATAAVVLPNGFTPGESVARAAAAARRRLAQGAE